MQPIPNVLSEAIRPWWYPSSDFLPIFIIATPNNSIHLLLVRLVNCAKVIHTTIHSITLFHSLPHPPRRKLLKIWFWNRASLVNFHRNPAEGHICRQDNTYYHRPYAHDARISLQLDVLLLQQFDFVLLASTRKESLKSAEHPFPEACG